MVFSRCKTCRWRKQIKLHELVKNFPNTFNLCRGDDQKLLLLLREGVYPYEYMNNMSKIFEKELTIIFIASLIFLVLAQKITCMQVIFCANTVWQFFKNKRKYGNSLK